MARSHQRQRDGDRTRAAILAAARQEFMDRGFEGARMREIGMRADAQQSLIYHYFPSKEALYEQVYAETLRPLFDVLEAQTQRPATSWQWVEELVTAYFNHLALHPELARLKSWEQVCPRLDETTTIGRDLRAWRLRLEAVLETLVAQGQLRPDVSPTTALASIISVVDLWHVALSRRAHTRPDPRALQQARLTEILCLLKGGLQG